MPHFMTGIPVGVASIEKHGNKHGADWVVTKFRETGSIHDFS